MSTGYLAAIATLCSWTISTFVLAKLSRLEESYILNKSVLFFSIFLLGILVCFIDRLAPWELFTIPHYTNWIWLGISGIVGKSIGDYCGYQSLRILGARRRSMITTLGPGFIWLFGLIILDEVVNWLGLTAMFVTVVCLLLLISSTDEKEEVKREKFGMPLPGLLFGIAGAALTGIAFIISKMNLIESGEKISAFHATWIRIITAFFALAFFDVARNKQEGFIFRFISDKQKGWLLFFAILFGAVLGLSFSLIAITELNAATAYTIFSLLPVSVTLISVIFFKKRISFMSWVYSFLAVGGVLVLVWRNELIKLF